MPISYDRERIHRLFLEYKGNVDSIMLHSNMPKSQKTIKRYAKEGGWYDELDGYAGGLGEIDDIAKLKKIRSNIYKFLISGSLGDQDNTELKPKTYTEAVKCYLEVDSRIDEKREDVSSPKSNSWEEIIKKCITLED